MMYGISIEEEKDISTKGVNVRIFKRFFLIRDNL